MTGWVRKLGIMMMTDYLRFGARYEPGCLETGDTLMVYTSKGLDVYQVLMEHRGIFSTAGVFGVQKPTLTIVEVRPVTIWEEA